MKFPPAIGLLLAIGVHGCASFSPAEYRTFQVRQELHAESRRFGLPLRSGQLIASDSGAPDSLLIPLIGEQFTSFLHAGILVIEEGEPYVYESYATLRLFGSGPPTSRLRGSIRRTPLERYLKRQRVTAIFDAPGVTDPAAVAAFARERLLDDTQFDPYFDWNDHGRLYCTEFVALALHAGGAPLPDPVRIRDHSSLQVALDWLGIHADTIVTVTSMVGDQEPVALLSKDFNLDQIDAHFAAKEELHRRFSADQKLGNVWSWSWRGLRLRPQVSEFLEAATARPHEPAAALAFEMFGPGPEASSAATPSP